MLGCLRKRAIVAAAFAPGGSVCEVARRADVVTSLIYRWRRELRAAAAGFNQVTVAPGADDRAVTSPALEIELGRDIRVRIAASAPKELVSAIIKALAAR